MRYIVTFSLLLSFWLFSSCEREISPAQADAFMKMIGSGTSLKASGLAVLGNGGYAVCGTDSSASGSKMVLYITDEYGNVKDGFPRYFTEGELNSGANTIVAKNEGQNGFLLSGYIENEAGDRDIYLVKTSLDGSKNWSKIYGSSEDEEVLHATEGIGYEFLLAGYQEKKGEQDIMIMAVNQNGDSIPLSLFYSKPPLSKDAAANFIYNAGDHYLCVCTFNSFIGEGTDILVLNFDDDLSPNNGVLEGQYDEFGKCLVQVDSTHFIVLGNRQNDITGKSEMLLYQVETSGLEISGSSYIAAISETGADLVAERLVRAEDGSLAIVGTRTNGSGKEVFVQIIRDYQPAERLYFGGSGDQYGRDIKIPEDDAFVITGDGGNEGFGAITLIKTDGNGNL